MGSAVNSPCPAAIPLIPYHHSVLNAANSECSRVLSFSDLRRSSCILPAAEKTRSAPAEEKGDARYCLASLASLDHVDSFI